MGAYSLLGIPFPSWGGCCLALDSAFGAAGRSLVKRVRELEGWDARFDLLETFLVARLEAGPVADPAVVWAWRRLRETAGQIRVAELAAELGCSRRYLLTRFREQVGLPPKLVARLLRFADVRQRIERGPRDWADIAFAAGYADQSHLVREFQQLAGTTPTEFVARLMPGGGLRGDAGWPAVTA